MCLNDDGVTVFASDRTFWSKRDGSNNNMELYYVGFSAIRARCQGDPGCVGLQIAVGGNGARGWKARGLDTEL